MHLFEWSLEKYALGLPGIDHQHGHLVKSIYDLYETMAETSDKSIIDPMLSELIFISRQHFDDEERLMLDYHYPDIESHIGRHMTFNEALANVVVHYHQGDISVSLDNLKFLSHWYIEHISTADHHYCDYIKKQSA